MTATAQLENNLWCVEQDLTAFIESQKKSLMRDKAELEKNNPRTQIPGGNLNSKEKQSKPDSNQNVLKNVDHHTRQRNEQISNLQQNDGLSLNLGGSENKQQKLREERQREYKEFLADQERRTSRKISTYDPDMESSGQQRYETRKDLKSIIDKEYDDLLKQKRKEERNYRVQFDVDATARSQQKKIIEFDSDDEELFQFVRRAKEQKRRKSAEPRERGVDKSDLKKAVVFEGRANSVPPALPAVFGGSSHSSLVIEKNKQYKKELEDQIKERELLKAKDKLKRLGRITSDVDISEIEIPESKHKWALPTKKMNKITPEKTDQSAQVSNRNIQEGFSNMNPYSMYMDQNAFPVNPMFNPIMNNGWQNYGMMAPGVYGGNAMMGYQQMQTGMPQTNMIRKQWNNTSEGENTSKAPFQSLDDSPQDKSYVPPAVEKYIPTRPNMQPPGGQQKYDLFGHSPGKEDNLSSKRAQQQAYQDELKRQMEEKKARANKEKVEREKYERKLEEEVATYDPWGKGGGGAPVRNRDGKIVADLRKFRPDDEPSNLPNRMDYEGNHSFEEPSPLMRALGESHNLNTYPDTSRSTVDDKLNNSQNASTYGRGAALKELQGISKSPRDKIEQDEYKRFLQQQVEEKKKKEDELKEKSRIEEEKESKRLAEQQRKMQEEFEMEKEKQRLKDEEVRSQNEQLRLLAEQKRYEEERKKKEIEAEQQREIQKEAQKKLEKFRIEENHVPPLRSDSPPVPAVIKERRRSKELQEQPPPPLSQPHCARKNDHKNEDMEYLNNIRHSLDHQSNIEQANVEQQKHLISQLSALRKQLQRQEIKVHSELEQSKVKYSELLSHPPKSHPKPQTKNVFEKAARKSTGKKRQQARTSPANSYVDTIQYDYTSDSDHKDFDSQQQEYMRQQELRLKALRQNVENKRYVPRMKSQVQATGSKQSLLDSDSKFYSMDSHDVVMPQQHESNERYNSARTRRREKEKGYSDTFEDFFTTKETEDTASISTFRVEDLAHKNEERLRKFNQNPDSDNNQNADTVVESFLRNNPQDGKETSLPADSYFTHVK